MLTDKVIYLRALEPSDIDIIFEWENNVELWNAGSTIAPFSRQQIIQYLKDYSSDIYTQRQIRFMVCLCKNDEPIGMFDIFDFDPHNSRAALGVMIDTASQRMGYGYRALALIERYAFSIINIHQLTAIVSSDNIASINLFKKSHFTLIGEIEDWLHTPNGYVSSLMFQKINN